MAMATRRRRRRRIPSDARIGFEFGDPWIFLLSSEIVVVVLVTAIAVVVVVGADVGCVILQGEQ